RATRRRQSRGPFDGISRLAKGVGLGHARPHPGRSHHSSKGAPAGVSVVVVGLNHRTVPLDVLERMTVSDARLPKALHDLAGREDLNEALVLSTCIRTETYAVANRFPDAVVDARNFLSVRRAVPPHGCAHRLYSAAAGCA